MNQAAKTYFFFVLFIFHIGRVFVNVRQFPWVLGGGAMVLGKLPVPGRPTIWIILGQGPTALAEGADGGCLDIFSLVYHFSFLSPALWETSR